MKKRCSTGVAGYLAGAVAARTGDEMSGPALMLAGLAATGSTGEASALLAGLTVAAAAGGPVLGAVLDRAARPGRLLAAALLLYAAGLAVVLGGLGRLPVAALVPVAVLAGLVGPALSGGWTSQLPRVAPEDGLARANALDSTSFSAAALLGPALAGVVAQGFGAPAAVVTAAVLVALAVPAAWRLPAARRPVARTPALRRPVLRRPVLRSSAGRSLVGDLAAGTRAIARTPALAGATLVSVGCCAAQGMLAVCVPLLGEQALGGAGRGAVLLSVAAVSALAVNALLARFPGRIAPDVIVRAAAPVQAAALLLAATGRPAVLLAAALLLGLGEGPQLTALFAVRHREAPEHLRGQVFTTGASLKISGFALGAAAAGPVAARSVTAALLLAAAVAALATLAVRTVPRAAPSPAADRS
ncbi:MFS transporter [Kitasatospora camelliae]|uniref:MFS transporter n=1 Tax=Kitasatospora camelliae TaxID=3156397 RepID=A0AAU8K6Z9_9ACTN